MPPEANQGQQQNQNQAAGAGAGGQATPPPGAAGGDAGQGTPEPHAAWYEALPAEAKAQADAYFDVKAAGLKSALDSEREQRKTAQARLAEAIEKATGAEKAALQKVSTDLEAANARADFFADAIEAKIADPRAAWAIIKEYGYFDRKGAPDFAALREHHPRLFGPDTHQANAHGGAGQGSGVGAPLTMDELMRAGLPGRGR